MYPGRYSPKAKMISEAIAIRQLYHIKVKRRFCVTFSGGSSIPGTSLS